MRIGHLIKHARSMDVAFSIVAIYEGTSYIKIKGYWINQAFTASYPLFDRSTTIRLPKSELPSILYCVTPNAKCVRYSNWRFYEDGSDFK